MDNDQLYVFKVKAIVISAGGGGFRPNEYPTHELTADGHAMAYNIGAEITGKEFVSPAARFIIGHGPESGWIPPMQRFTGGSPGNLKVATRLINAEDDEVPCRGMAWHGWLDAHYEAHAGRAPVYIEAPNGHKEPVSGPGAFGSMHGHATAGIFPVDTECATGIPGLYAAGDSLGTQFVGAMYSGFGFATAQASVTGARAGTAAAGVALEAEKVSIDEEGLELSKKIVLRPLERKGGFTPRWVTNILRNIMLPYFVMYIKHEDRMRAALINVEFLRDHIVPKMTAKDPHELRLAHETKSMVLNAEMKLRASMFRKESRGNHYREDYPRRDDPDWLAWVLLKEENGSMKVYKKPMPEDWRPDLSKPYEERYPLWFPEE